MFSAVACNMEEPKELSVKPEMKASEGPLISGLAAVAIVIAAVYMRGGKDGRSPPDNTGTRIRCSHTKAHIIRDQLNLFLTFRFGKDWQGTRRPSASQTCRKRRNTEGKCPSKLFISWPAQFTPRTLVIVSSD